MPDVSAAAGATPWGAIAQGAIGLAQTIGGWVQQRKATKALEKLQSPIYTKNQSIMDYYNQALSRYGVSPTESAMYKRSMSNIGRNQAGAISGLQDRRSATGGISSILRASNDAALDADVAAENEKSNRFGQLGGATQMKAGEDRLAYQYNELAPFERKYNLLAAKASGGNQVANSGISNIFGGLQNIQNMDAISSMYGGVGSGKGGFWNSQVSKLYRK